MSELETRIMELEIKNAHQEDTIEQLNQIVIQQQQKFDELFRHLEQLKTQVSHIQESSTKEAPEPPPPHY